MQITQIEMFKFKNADIECLNQISNLFIAFIDLCNVIGE